MHSPSRLSTHGAVTPTTNWDMFMVTIPLQLVQKTGRISIRYTRPYTIAWPVLEKILQGGGGGDSSFQHPPNSNELCYMCTCSFTLCVHAVVFACRLWLGATAHMP